jgi:hypothetical protein
MLWNPLEHSDEDNVRWSRLRATEWLNWPLFLSQAFAPFLLVKLDWKVVLGVVLLSNYLWVFFVRYRFVSVPAAYLGVLFIKLKWVACPGVAAYLWVVHDRFSALLALLWPVLLVIVPLVPLLGLLIMTPGKIGHVQTAFMRELGYKKGT